MKRIHESWEFMRPNENEKSEDFRFEEYFERIRTNKRLCHIPKTIFEQWIYYHHSKEHSLQNYAWINYERIEFDLCEWDYDKLKTVYVIEDFRDYYTDRSKYTDFDQFCCTDEDLGYWRANGTWRTPPIILDLRPLSSKIPKWCELVPPYQLIEGHSRLGYLNSMKRISDLNKGEIAMKHKIYILKEKVRTHNKRS